MKDKKSYAFYWVVTLPMTSLTYPQRPEITHILTFWAFFQNHSLLSGVIVVRACVHQRSYSGDDEAEPCSRRRGKVRGGRGEVSGQPRCGGWLGCGLINDRHPIAGRGGGEAGRE